MVSYNLRSVDKKNNHNRTSRLADDKWLSLGLNHFPAESCMCSKSGDETRPDFELSRLCTGEGPPALSYANWLAAARADRARSVFSILANRSSSIDRGHRSSG